MNLKMAAIGAGIAAVIAGVIALLPYLRQGDLQNQQAALIQEVSIGLDNVHVVRGEDGETATIEVTLSILNPTRSTLILEHVKYTLYANDIRVAESMIGESLQGIVTASGKTNYILPSTPLMLKDTIKVSKVRALEGVWDALMEGSVRWRVDGTYSITGWQEKRFDAIMG